LSTCGAAAASSGAGVIEKNSGLRALPFGFIAAGRPGACPSAPAAGWPERLKVVQWVVVWRDRKHAVADRRAPGCVKVANPDAELAVP
jgi:hypothetical protein